MAHVRDSNRNGPLDAARLAAFEAQVGAKLPDEYREFLLTHNGGELSPDELVLPGETEPFSSLAGPLFGLHDGPSALDEVWENCDGEVPPELLAFAQDVGGNLLCIGIRGESRGRVYFWDHDGADPGADEPGWDNVTPLARSFGAFLNHLGAPQPGG